LTSEGMSTLIDIEMMDLAERDPDDALAGLDE
jgi:hypothetical protein